MSETYTPGPWTLNDKARFEIRAEWNNMPDVLIATVGLGSTNRDRHIGDRDIDHANARLIAAAPDLLAALQSLEAFVGVMHGKGEDAVIPETINTPLGVPVKVGEIMREARAAIAKASAPTPARKP